METADRLFGTEGTPDLNFQMACEAPFHMFSRDNTSVFDSLFPASFSGLQGNLMKIISLVPLAHFSHLVKRRYSYQLLSKNSFTCLYFAVSVSPHTFTSRYRIQYFSFKIRIHAYVKKEDENLVN